MKRKLIIVLAVILAGIIIYILASNFGRSRDSYQFSGESYENAKRFKLVAKFIPPQAREINYYILPIENSLSANFKISEKYFQDWAGAKKWPLETVNESAVGRFIAGMSSERMPHINDYIILKSGYFYTSQDNNWNDSLPVITFAYDKNTGISYLMYFEIVHDR